jgi:hypothetical protein
MGDGNGQPKFVGEILEPGLPREAAVAIGPATISFEQQLGVVRVDLASHPDPPRAEGPDRKLGGVMRNPDDHIAFIPSHIIDAIGNRFADRVTGKVIDQDRMRRAAPLAARVLEETNQFLLLGIHANHRPTTVQKRFSSLRNVPKLFIPSRRLLARQALLVYPQGVGSQLQQSAARWSTDRIAPARQRASQGAQRLMCPFEPRDRVPGGCIPHLLVQDGQQPRLFFSLNRLPPPGARTRPLEARSRCSSSRCPRRIVVRLIPVTRATCWTPPYPRWAANSPTKRRRCFSSKLTTTRLMLTCNFAVSPCGCRVHSSQVH